MSHTSHRCLTISWLLLHPFVAGFLFAGTQADEVTIIDFTPPSRAQQLAAIGPTSKEATTMRRALNPRHDFQPIPKPDLIDWLAQHPEPGQTFEQFVQSRPHRPDDLRGKIYLQPLGRFSENKGVTLEELRRFTSAYFMMEVVVLPPLDISQNYITTRQNRQTQSTQMLTADVLKLLWQRLPKDAFALLGITMTDLYPDPSWNYVFGQASTHARVGVYSFARYDPAFNGEKPGPTARQALLPRECKILAHETSHMFGVEHCTWFLCVINGINHLAELDSRPLHLCPVDLRKLQWSNGFDVVERYRRLRDFYHHEGMTDEAEWIDQRMRFISGR